MMQFVDRERALKILHRFWISNDVLLILYGRRRIGKSRLIKEFLKELNSQNYVYLIASRRPLRYNLSKFSRKLSAVFGVKVPIFKDIIELFGYLSSILGDKKFLVVIDEFTYLVEQDEGVLSDIQEVVDEILPKTKIKLILTGSLVGMMESRVLGYTSPIYGRANRIIKLPPLSLHHLAEWFRGASWESIFKIYAVTGGVPKYLEFFRGISVEEEIKQNFFDDSSFLFRDAIELLKEELRDPSTYITILEVIANGMTKLSEISNYTLLKQTKLSSYLAVLRNLGIVRREIPIFAPKRARRGIYIISDYYYLFWFRFVSPYFDDIESGFPEDAIKNFEKNFNTFLGLPFEYISRRLIRKVMLNYDLRLNKIGKWWHRNIDIDIVAIEDKKRIIIFGEAKWAKLKTRDIDRLLAKLEDKAEIFPYKRNYKKIYCIVAREFEKKDIDTQNVILIDLHDLVSRGA